MAQATRKKQPLNGFSAHVGQTMREASLFVFGALAAYLSLALLTYHAADMGPTSTESVTNGGGIAGALFSDFALSMFGYLSYLLPVMVAYGAWILFRGRKKDQLSQDVWPLLIFRLSGFMLTLGASTTLAQLHFSYLAAHQPFRSGGIMGELIGQSLVDLFSFTGSTLFLLALLLTGITLLTGLSWFLVIDTIGKYTLFGLNFLNQGVHNIYDNIRDRIEGVKASRQREVKIEKERKNPKPKPRIEPVIKMETGARAKREKQLNLFDEPIGPEDLPPLSLLNEPVVSGRAMSDKALKAMSRQLELKLKDFNIEVQVVAVQPGPVITRFEIQPAAGVKVNQISNLAKDLARSLSVTSVRVVEIIAGKSVIGIEVPNEHREMVFLSEVLQSKQYDQSASPLTMALGKDISGIPTVADLAKMPHLLVAGTTGSGKSVALNAMILSVLYKASAEQVRMIMIDPKMLELSVYEGIPHLLAPVVTDMKDAANALRWCVAEMERRYRLMATLGVRNLAGYNRKIKDANKIGHPIADPFFILPEEGNVEQKYLEYAPRIVVVVDELADMMMMVGKKVEELIARLAQKARAAGIHLILATQRPSVDVITGLIKANVPTRIAFQVSSKIDSRTILDQMGAEQLLGHGDMLHLPPGTGIPQRVHGAFVGDQEVHNVARFVKQSGPPNYIDGLLESERSDLIPEYLNAESDDSHEVDALYDQAVQIVTETRRASISSVQRKLKVGYNRAARMVEAMEAAGVVGQVQSNGLREVLAPPPMKD